MSMSSSDDADPYSMFNVKAPICDVLDIKVLQGRNITKGTISDYIDTPDPYVQVDILVAPDSVKRTKSISNDADPQWFETLRYYLPHSPSEPTIAKISLYDENYTIDQHMGTVELNVNEFQVGDDVIKTFKFDNNSEVDIQFKRELNSEYDLRYSLMLCKEEKNFRLNRKKKVMMKLRELLKERGPNNVRETPCVAVMGSGGGYRASVAFSGAISALQEIGVFDCSTYTVGLSGSTWCMSSLYSHPSFPENGVDYAFNDLRKNLDKSFGSMFLPSKLMTYLYNVKAKRQLGQPATLTDFFGMVIGEHVLGSDMASQARLSDFKEKVKDGQAPMPLMTCLHVRPDVSAAVYHEWIEFSPFEIGMAKYGVFVKTSDFNKKFFKGVISKHHEEAPLHFLMGIWGSGFAILFDRLMNTNDEKRGKSKHQMESEMNGLRESSLSNGEKFEEADSDDEGSCNEEITHVEKIHKEHEEISQENSQAPTASKSLKSKLLESILTSKFFNSREYRAGRILNFMRGLEVSCSFPLSPFTTNEVAGENPDELFGRLDETISGEKKRVCIVDAGLAYNSPYPALLRPQRFVDLIISFDFSAREKDDMDPFGELVLAEKWARLHNIPFPKIDTDVYKREGLKELYIFKDEDNPKAPIILHFCLCNVQYRKYSAPSVPREPDDNDGDFNIFAEETPYSTFDFHYEPYEFNKLHKLVRFNTLLNKDKILEAIADCVEMRKQHKMKYKVSVDAVKSSLYLNEEKKKMYAERFGQQFAYAFDPKNEDLSDEE